MIAEDWWRGSPFSQTVRTAGLRCTRYIFSQKTYLQHVATVAATNMLPLVSWLSEMLLAPTRTARVAALADARRTRPQYHIRVK